jgi:hypothetical protein
MGASAMSYLRPPTIALTDDDGNFSFEGLFGESFMVKAVGPHGALYSKPTLAEGKETVTLSLAPISSLHATVEHDGEPVENFEVDVTGGPSPVASSMVRKRNGAFEIPNLISGEYAVTVRAGQRYAREVVQVGPRPRTRVQLEVLPAPRIRGRVVDENGDPGTQAQFMLMPDNMSFFDPSWEFEREPVQADGSFEVRDMLAGRWTAMIRATDGSTKTFMLFEFDLDPGQELDLGTLVLGTRLPLSEAPFLDRSPDLGIRFFVGPTPPDPEALDRVDQAADPRSVIETEGASLWIAQVEPDSPAEQAGLQAGDAVLAVGRTEVGMDRPPLEEMISLSRRWRSAGRPVDWTIERGGARQVLSVLVPSASSDGP